MLVATREPIAVSETASTAIATNTSTSVKPARLSRASPLVDGNNLDSSCEPVDPHLIARPLMRQRNGPATRHARREVADGCARRSVFAARGEHCVEVDIRGKAHNASTGAGADGPR